MKVPVIKGKNVVLRPLSLLDAPRFVAWLSDSEVTKFLDRKEDPPTLREERQWILETKRKKDGANFSIDTLSGKHIGTAGLNPINFQHKRALFGIFIGDKKYWGQGCGTEAGRLIARLGFKKLKLHRISLHVIVYNIRAIKAYKKIGFKIEGRLRDHIYRDGHYHDSIWMGMLEKEYNVKR